MSSIARTLKRYLVPASISVFVGFGIWLYTRDTQASLIIGLLTNLTFLFVEYFQVIHRVSRYLDTHGEIVDASDGVVALAAKARQISEQGPPLARALSETAIERLDADLGALLQGRWTVHSFEGFVEVAERLFERFDSGREYWGTSVCRDYQEYWPSALGRRFVDSTAAAIRRGAKVKRVFICTTTEDLKKLEPTMQRQRELGIQVRYLIESDSPAGVPIADFGVWDKKTVVELSEARYRGNEFRATFHFVDGEVGRFCKMFLALYDAATEYKPAPKAGGGGGGGGPTGVTPSTTAAPTATGTSATTAGTAPATPAGQQP